MRQQLVVSDQLITLSKFLLLGMSIERVIEASTQAQARAIRRPELGTLGPGNVGDATVLELEEGEFEFTDVRGETRTGGQMLRLKGMVIAGHWWE